MHIRSNTESKVIEEQIKSFYSKIMFPGEYTFDDLSFYDEIVVNDFLSAYDNAVSGNERILDLGCGSGFICNFIGRKYPGVVIDAVDFSDSIDYATKFSKDHQINNIRYYKTNFFNFKPKGKYDIIISNGVLHHIPEYLTAIEKAKSLLKKQGKIVAGVYNSYGKLAKQLFPIKYRCKLLCEDQESVPYETSFTNKEFLNFFNDFKIKSIYPSFKNHFVDAYNIFNYKNGGLTIYELEAST